MVRDEFIITPFLKLCLEGEKTVIYVGNEKYNQCKRLVGIDPLEDVREPSLPPQEHWIDRCVESHEKYDRKEIGDVGGNEMDGTCLVTPEEEFWGYISNLQAWVESGYNSLLLHTDIAFPLLRRLVGAGDESVRNALNSEIVSRSKSGFFPVLMFLTKQGNLSRLNGSELEDVLDSISTLGIEDRMKVYMQLYLRDVPRGKDLFLNMFFTVLDRASFEGMLDEKT